MYNYCYYQNHLCRLLLVAQEQQLQRMHFVQKHNPIKPPLTWAHDANKFKKICKQLDLYFANKLKKFTVRLIMQGTSFEKQVWQALQKIPYGKTISYGTLAKNINHVNAARAVGNAANKNPFPIIIPCHRLIGTNGDLVGFAAGLSMKMALLQLEGYIK